MAGRFGLASGKWMCSYVINYFVGLGGQGGTGSLSFLCGERSPFILGLGIHLLNNFNESGFGLSTERKEI